MKPLVATLVALAALSAQAANINSAADPLLAGAAVLDFESVASGPYSALSAGGVDFSVSPGTSLYIHSDYAGQYNTTGQSLSNTYNTDAFGALTITFTQPTQAFGFNWGAADTVWTLSAYDASSTLLGSRTLAATHESNAGEFFGLAFGSDIAYATIVGERGDYVFVDNLTMAAAVPEPASFGLLALGLLGLGAASARRRAA